MLLWLGTAFMKKNNLQIFEFRPIFFFYLFLFFFSFLFCPHMQIQVWKMECNVSHFFLTYTYDIFFILYIHFFKKFYDHHSCHLYDHCINITIQTSISFSFKNFLTPSLFVLTVIRDNFMVGWTINGIVILCVNHV